MKLAALFQYICPDSLPLLDKEPQNRLLDQEVHSISADSRSLLKGAIFVAQQGVKNDGAHFISDAIKKGAIAVIFSQKLQESDFIKKLQENAAETLFLPLGNPALFLAKASALLAGTQPETLIAITGTNGKTSTADFIRQIWRLKHYPSATIGTLGLISDIALPPLPPLTTPDAVSLAQSLAALKQHHIDHVVCEASSHGIVQYRLHGLALKRVGFTNLTRDHLDYHHTMEEYRQAKLKLLRECLPSHHIFSYNSDSDLDTVNALKEIIHEKHFEARDIGSHAETLRILNITPLPDGQELTLQLYGEPLPPLKLALPGRFQAENALLAASLCWEGKEDAAATLSLLPFLKPVPGRCEYIGSLPNGASIYVDYAHTADALENILKSLLPHTKNKLHVIFGAGGDRDKGKRPLMGKAAATYAHHLILTDDNPRFENPQLIRDAIQAGIEEKFLELPTDKRPLLDIIPNREEAILTSIQHLQPGDLLLIAGKGHESGQIIGDKIYPFDDREKAHMALATFSHKKPASSEKEAVPIKPLWKRETLLQATAGTLEEEVFVKNISLDTRHIQEGDLFIAIKGDKFDGHDYIAQAFEKGAACVIADTPEKIPPEFKSKILFVKESFSALYQLAQFARQNFQGCCIAVTGSVGKTTTKEMLKTILSAYGKTHASAASHNNHYGVPLTLANLPQDADFCISEVGMNHPGEIAELAALIQPHHALITTIGTAHLGYMGSIEAIATEKASLFSALSPIPKTQYPSYNIAIAPNSLKKSSLKKSGTIYNLEDIFKKSLAAPTSPDIKPQLFLCDFHHQGKESSFISNLKLNATTSSFIFHFKGQSHPVALPFPGKHLVENTSLILTLLSALGLPLEPGLKALSSFKLGAGRGAPYRLKNGALLIDESYNASLESITASLETLALFPAKRHLIALGDMLELGEFSQDTHLALLPTLIKYQFLCFCCGQHMSALYHALPSELQGGYAANAQELAPLVRDRLHIDDIILVKGSFGSQMRHIVTTLHAADFSSSHGDQ